MDLFLNLLRAFGILFGIYFLLIAGLFLTMLFVLLINGCSVFLSDLGLKREENPSYRYPILCSLLIYSLAFATLYLSPHEQKYVMIGVAVILMTVYLYAGISLHYNIRDKG